MVSKKVVEIGLSATIYQIISMMQDVEKLLKKIPFC